MSLPGKFAPPPILISVAQACAAAGVGTTMLYELMGAGAIRSVKVGRRRLVERDSIKRWQASLIANEGLANATAQQQEASHV